MNFDWQLLKVELFRSLGPRLLSRFNKCYITPSMRDPGPWKLITPSAENQNSSNFDLSEFFWSHRTGYCFHLQNPIMVRLSSYLIGQLEPYGLFTAKRWRKCWSLIYISRIDIRVKRKKRTNPICRIFQQKIVSHSTFISDRKRCVESGFWKDLNEKKII